MPDPAPVFDDLIFTGLANVLPAATLSEIAAEAEREITRRLDAIAAAGVGGDVRVAHDLAGLCGQMGLAALAEAARMLERAGRAGDGAGAAQAAEALTALRAPSLRALAAARRGLGG